MIDYHRTTKTAYELYKDLETLNKSDLFFLWSYITSNPKCNTIFDVATFSFLKEEKYDLMENLESKLLSPFVCKYLLVKFGKKEIKSRV